MAGPLRTAPLEPAPVPDTGPPVRRLGPRQWMRENLFSTWFNTLLTVVFGLFVGWALWRLGRFVFVDARWEIIERNLRLLLVFRFPADEVWRLWAALFLLSATFGLAVGATAKVRAAEIAAGRARPLGRRVALRRAGPFVVLVAVVLWFAASVQATLFVIGATAVGVVARYLGTLVPARQARWTILVAFAGLVVAFATVAEFGGQDWTEWGGLLLTLLLAVGGIVISFPLGVLFALGRRSSLPAVRVVCVVYIELLRAVPLITVLFMAFLVIGFFLPPELSTPSLVTRALIGIVLFTSAYVAEIVRGGIQAIPKGQFEAAAALGLSTVKTVRLIILPQALRAVIPALVSQFISLFKDTSLVSIIGLVELLGVGLAATKQPAFLAQGLIFEVLVFVAFVYWVACYSMSRESQRLERRLGVGER